MAGSGRHVLRGIAVAETRLGEFGKASAHLQRALELAGEADDPLAAAQACLGLAELALASGAPDRSVVLAEHAVDAFRKMGTRHGEREALKLLGEASSARADRAAADAAATRAASLPENG